MTNRSEGYVEGLDYAARYFADLSPMRIPLTLLSAGVVPPQVLTACELGFGQGLTVNVHAAASRTEWFGTDFNSGQVSYAQELAAASGAAATLFDEPFGEFCRRADLPDFDFIALHGVWSWISDENRRTIVDFLDRKLKLGGVVFISYNTPPGHAAYSPVRDVLYGHAEWMNAPALELPNRVEGALKFVEALLAASPALVQANPQIAEWVKHLRSEDRGYITHEYFNHDWVPTSFARMSEWLAPADLSYVCSPNISSSFDLWNVRPEQRAILGGIADTKFRETVRDLMMQRRFRKDYWVKGLRRTTAAERLEGLRRQSVMLTWPRHMITVSATGALGSFAPPAAVCDPVLDALADYQPRTLGEIEQAVKASGVDFSVIVQVMLMLIEAGNLCAVQDNDVINAAQARTDRLNAALTDMVRYRARSSILASPVSGAGFTDAGRGLQLFWHAMRAGKEGPAELAAHAAQILRAEGMMTFEEEKLFVSPEQNPTAVNAATMFTRTMLPLLKELRIA